MLTFLTLIILVIVIYFVVKKLIQQREIINELRNELTKINKIQARQKK
jgi:heme exporter protein D